MGHAPTLSVKWEAVGDGGHEALTEETAGLVSSHEMTFRMPTVFRERKAIWSSSSTRDELRSGASPEEENAVT
jgi:hypothetical protein